MMKPLYNNLLYVIPSHGRDNRTNLIKSKAAPKEFFYGSLNLKDYGYNIEYADARGVPSDFLSKVYLHWEIKRNSIINMGSSSQRVAAIKEKLKKNNIILSFTDGMSLSLGLYAKRYLKNESILIGGFMRLPDMENCVRKPFKKYASNLISQSLKNLDHIFFLNDHCMSIIQSQYNLPDYKCDVLNFGVDTDFWCPAKKEKSSGILAVGSDPSRNYNVLKNIKIKDNITIITSQKLNNLKKIKNIKIIHGNLYNSKISDYELREFYREAFAVLVPLKDVNQPVGQSVALQAMAMGKPLILTKIKGHWSNSLISWKNCILVPPNDIDSIENAIKKLKNNQDLYKNICLEARKTVLKNYNLVESLRF